MKFKKLEKRVDFPELEGKVLKYWKENDVLKKYLRKNEDKSKRFSFFDGPITANNPMGVHHARGRSFKDLIQRFKNMQGYKQRFQNGFDCQGLWVEVEVEKSLGFNTKKDIEDYGLGKFTQKCKERVRRFAKKITDQSKRLGYFMDWDNSYFTFSERNNLHIWHFLKKCYEKGLIYKSHSAVAWCPRCETGLSKHEQADGYKMITDLSLYIKFPLKDREDEYLLAWTTTPWTLTANVLLAVNPEFQYVKSKKEGETLYLAEESAKRLNLDYEKIDGEKLVGLKYESLFPHLPAGGEVDHFVVEWKEVDPSEGTGVVHIAPGCGEEDFELGKEVGVPAFSPIDEKGEFKSDWGEFAGENAHEVKEKVISFLKKKNLLFKTENITHSYPHCWRCKTKCLFRLEDNWFIDCQKIKGRLKEKMKDANWIPSYVERRMEDWLENMGDWMISRRRFYGLSLPFYECGECGGLTVVGSKEELSELAVNPERVDTLPSLHRPWIDEVEVKCPECGKLVKRIEEVGDCWLDAGVVPFSTLDYLSNKAYWKKWFPADFISEMIEQVRLWYYSMLVYGVVLEDEVPYKNVVSYDEVRDEEGEAMSKSKGNGIPYDEAVENMGADVMRWIYFSKNPNAPVNFGYKLAEKVKRGFLFTLWNCYKFFLEYASLEVGGEIDLEGLEQKTVLDRWIVSRLNKLKKEVTESLEEFSPAPAVRAIEDFVLKDLSTWYIRRSRDRIGPSAEDGEDKKNCYLTFYLVLTEVAKTLAPFLPFLSEKLSHSLGYENSVHLEDWPSFKREKIDEEVEEKMEMVREVCSLAHRARRKAGIKTRQALKEMQVKTLKSKLEEGFTTLIKDEVNVEEVYFVENFRKLEKEERVKGERIEVSLETEITPRLKRKGVLREVVRRVQFMRKKSGLKPSDTIQIYYNGSSKLERMIEEEKKELKKETIASSVDKEAEEKEGVMWREYEIKSMKIKLGIKKI